jgi:hypothetical protein
VVKGIHVRVHRQGFLVGAAAAEGAREVGLDKEAVPKAGRIQAY